jgi:hypothetical protein
MDGGAAAAPAENLRDDATPVSNGIVPFDEQFFADQYKIGPSAAASRPSFRPASKPRW